MELARSLEPSQSQEQTQETRRNQDSAQRTGPWREGRWWGQRLSTGRTEAQTEQSGGGHEGGGEGEKSHPNKTKTKNLSLPKKVSSGEGKARNGEG